MNTRTSATKLFLILLGGVIFILLFGYGKSEGKKKQSDAASKTETSEVKSAGTLSEKKKSDKKEEIKVTFVELGSVGCIPCKMMQPVMEEVEKEYGNQVKVLFYDVWTEEGKPYAEKYKIRTIPTQVFLDKDGNEYYRHTGFFPKEEIIKILKMKGVK